MRVVYLRRAAEDYQWFYHYYTNVFPEGRISAFTQYMKILKLIMDHPQIGKPAGRAPRRNFKIPNTPFTIGYQIRSDTLEITRLRDERSAKRHNTDFE
jgi:plasmid stabilization system protein ParE